MNLTKQTANLREDTIFTREEVTNTGCCFSIFSSQKDQHQQMGIPPRSRSEAKIKKIDIVTSKRGKTLDKDIRQAVSQSIKAKPFSCKGLKQAQGCSSQTSKTTTQKNSLKSSKAKLVEPEGKPIKLTLTDRYEKYISLNNQGVNKPMEITFNQTRSDNSNIQYLSEISIVQEEFISYESNTWRALNIIPSRQIEKHKNKQQSVTPVRYMMDLTPNKYTKQTPQTPNPLQRLLQKKRAPKPERSQLKLVL